MTKILATVLFAVLAGTLAVHAMPPAIAAKSAPVQPSFDIVMPAPHEPFDQTEITPVETVGASRTE
ncbi:MAG: hypothetical protein ABI671_16145 [Burkholderiales bacterium]